MIYTVFLPWIFLLQYNQIASESNGGLCDIRRWYLTLMAQGVFDGPRTTEQLKIQSDIEGLVLRGQTDPDLRLVGCSLLQNFLVGLQGSKPSEDTSKEGNIDMVLNPDSGAIENNAQRTEIDETEMDETEMSDDEEETAEDDGIDEVSSLAESGDVTGGREQSATERTEESNKNNEINKGTMGNSGGIVSPDVLPDKGKVFLDDMIRDIFEGRVSPDNEDNLKGEERHENSKTVSDETAIESLQVNNTNSSRNIHSANEDLNLTVTANETRMDVKSNAVPIASMHKATFQFGICRLDHSLAFDLFDSHEMLYLGRNDTQANESVNNTNNMHQSGGICSQQFVVSPSYCLMKNVSSPTVKNVTTATSKDQQPNSTATETAVEVGKTSTSNEDSDTDSRRHAVVHGIDEIKDEPLNEPNEEKVYSEGDKAAQEKDNDDNVAENDLPVETTRTENFKQTVEVDSSAKIKQNQETEFTKVKQATTEKKDKYHSLDIDQLETLIISKTKDYEIKMQTLELTIMKLENQLLTEKVNKQNHTSSMAKLENQILKLENELLKMNQSYYELKYDNEVLKKRQRRYLELGHSSMNTSSDGQHHELITEQQAKISQLSQLLRNQSAAITEMRQRSDYLEDQNRMLYQMVMNQTALMSQIMMRVQELSEQNIKQREEAQKLKEQLQTEVRGIVEKKEEQMKARDLSEKMLRDIDNMVSDTKLDRNRKEETLIVNEVKPAEQRERTCTYQFQKKWCFGDCLCIYNSIIYSWCTPYSSVFWTECGAIYFMNKSEDEFGPHTKEVVTGDPSTVKSVADSGSDLPDVLTVTDSNHGSDALHQYLTKADDNSKVQNPRDVAASIVTKVEENSEKLTINSNEQVDDARKAANNDIKDSKVEDISLSEGNSIKMDDTEKAQTANQQVVHTNPTNPDVEKFDPSTPQINKTETEGSGSDDPLGHRQIDSAREANQPTADAELYTASDVTMNSGQLIDRGQDGSLNIPDHIQDSGQQKDIEHAESKDLNQKLSDTQAVSPEQTQGASPGQTQGASPEQHVAKEVHQPNTQNIGNHEQMMEGWNPNQPNTQEMMHQQPDTQEQPNTAEMNQQQNVHNVNQQQSQLNQDLNHNQPNTQEKKHQQPNIQDLNQEKLYSVDMNQQQHKRQEMNQKQGENQQQPNVEEMNQEQRAQDANMPLPKEQSVNEGLPNTLEKIPQDDAAGTQKQLENAKVSEQPKVAEKDDTPGQERAKQERNKEGKITSQKKKTKGKQRMKPKYAGTSTQTEPKDCYDIYLQGKRRNQVHRIKPYGQNTMIEVFCDMKNEGWTVIQKRQDGTTNFFREWEEYKKGFGGVYGEHWIGNDILHKLTNQDEYMLRIDLMDWTKQTRYAVYEHFLVEDEQEGYRLHVEGYSGDAGDAMNKHNGHKFSTKDVDNDKVVKEFGGSCATRFSGAGWYYKCYQNNLNGKYYRGGEIPEKRYDGITWKPWTGPNYSLKQVEMKIRPLSAWNMKVA